MDLIGSVIIRIMKKRILIGAIIIVSVGLAIAIGIYFKRTDTPLSPLGSSEQMPEEKTLVKDDFSILSPQGWEEASAPAGVSLMMIKPGEKMTDPAAEKLNFKSYFSVSHDSPQSKTKEEYLQDVRNGLKQAFPDIVYDKDESITLGAGEAQAMEFAITQQGVDFKVLLNLVWGKNNDAWVISFNTTKDKWNEYKNLFYRITDSFRIK